MGTFLLITTTAGCVASRSTSERLLSTSTLTCESSMCADDGFDIEQDGFSFPNWNEVDTPHSSVDIQMLVKMFGHAVVCRPGEASSCTPTPRALHLIDEWNTALSGGRCEGMAVLSERMFINLTRPHDFDPSIQTTAQLSRGNATLENAITFWWATQFTDDIAAIAHSSRQDTPTQIVEQLVHGLSTSVGYTLALYDHGLGHSLTPYAVSETSDGWQIHVYDNNFPGVENHIDVVASTQQWTYTSRQSISNDSVQTRQNGLQWSGSTGSIELTPMNARSGPFQCSSCDDQSGDTHNSESIEISLVPLSQHGEVGLEILSGGKIITTLGGLPRNEHGIDVMVSKDASASTLTRVRIPAELQPIEVRAVSSSLTISPPPILLAVTQPGVASVHLRGMLTRQQAHAKTMRDTAPALFIDQSGLRFSTDVHTSASIGVTSDITELDVQPGHTLEIVRRDNTRFSVIDERFSRIFSRSYSSTQLRDTSVVRRHRMTYSNNAYTTITTPLLATPLVVSSLNETASPSLSDTTTRITTPNIFAPDNTASAQPEDGQRQQQIPVSSSIVPANSLSPTSTTPSGNHSQPVVVTTFTAAPQLLYVDKSDSAWIRTGNERALTVVSPSGAISRREIAGVPIAATEDEVGALWVLLQQPDRVLQITSSSLIYHSYPELTSARSISFSPQQRHVVIAGGSDASSYVATLSAVGTLHVTPIPGISRPDKIIVDKQGNSWFSDAGGGSISKLSDDQTVTTFRRSTVMARELTLGPDNAVWFVNNVAGFEIGRVSRKGTFSFISLPSHVHALRDITTVDSSLWFTAQGFIGSMTLDKTFTQISDHHAWGQGNIASRNSRSLWLTNSNFFTLSRITM